MKPAKGFFRVMSSHGELVAASDTGAVVRRERYERNSESEFIDHIVRFDVIEWTVAYPTQGIDRACLDILDLGYTYRLRDGALAHEPPAFARADKKEVTP